MPSTSAATATSSSSSPNGSGAWRFLIAAYSILPPVPDDHGARPLPAPRVRRTVGSIRAVPAPPPPTLALGLGPTEAAIVNELWAYHAGALGSVGVSDVAFDASATAGSSPSTSSTRCSTTAASASSSSPGRGSFASARRRGRSPLGTTSHRVYSLLRTPTAPWQQQPYDAFNTQLPWTNVLDWAALWATGAFDEVAAASAITAGVFAQGGWSITYGCQFNAPSRYSFRASTSTRFLERLAGLPGHGVFSTAATAPRSPRRSPTRSAATWGSRRCSTSCRRSRPTRRADRVAVSARSAAPGCSCTTRSPGPERVGGRRNLRRLPRRRRAIPPFGPSVTVLPGQPDVRQSGVWRVPRSSGRTGRAVAVPPTPTSASAGSCSSGLVRHPCGACPKGCSASSTVTESWP